jgi:hypothetical protein
LDLSRALLTKINPQWIELESKLMEDPLMQLPINLMLRPDGEELLAGRDIEDVMRDFSVRQMAKLARSYIPIRPTGLTAASLAKGFCAFLPTLLSRSHPLFSKYVDATEHFLRSGLLYAMIKKMYTRSLLSEFAFFCRGSKIVCTPYHAYALHEVEFRNRPDLIIGRPGVVADAAAVVFSDEIRQLEFLINDPRTR